MKLIWNQTLVINSSVTSKYCTQTLLSYIKWRRYFKKFFFLSKNTTSRKCLHTCFCIIYYLCKTLLCSLLLDACLGNGKPRSHHKPYTSLHCVFYTESPTESKSSDERGRYRSCKMKGRTDSFTFLSWVPCSSLRSNLERDGSLAPNIITTTQVTNFA